MPQLKEEITPEEIATITGYEQEKEKDLLDSESLLDEEDLIEEKDPTQNPWVRFGFIGTFAFLMLGLLGLLLFVFSSSGSIQSDNSENGSSEESEVFDDSQEMSQLKAELALRDQQVTNLPVPQQIENVDEQPQPQKITTPSRPKVNQRPIPRPTPKPKTVVAKVDSQRRWQELSQIGASKSKGEPQDLPLVVNQPQIATEENLIASNQLIISDQSSLPPQKAIALLEDGIAIPARRIGSQSLTVPIVLSESLRDRRDKEVIPAGAVIIAEVKNNGSVMEITPQTISFARDEQYYELSLDPGSMIVTGSQGPVIANIQTVGAEGKGLSVSQISQLAALTGAFGKTARDFSLFSSAVGLDRNRRNYSRSDTVALYTVPQGTEVLVRIVRNFSIELPSDNDSSEFISPQAPVKTAYKSEQYNFEKEYEFDEQYREELDFDRVEQQELDFDY